MDMRVLSHGTHAMSETATVIHRLESPPVSIWHLRWWNLLGVQTTSGATSRSTVSHDVRP
jgi:hypothetical protein